MNRIFLRKGFFFRLAGRDCIIEARLPNDELRIKDLASGSCFVRSYEQLVDALADGQLDFSEKSWREAANRRLPYVSEISRRGLAFLTANSLCPLIADVAQTIGDPVAPSRRTVCRWYRTFKPSRVGFRSLLPVYGISPERRKIFDPDKRLTFEKGKGAYPTKKGDSA